MKRYISNSLLVLSSLAFFVVTLEAALALFWPHKLPASAFLHDEYDPLLGWRNSPDVKGLCALPPRIKFYRQHNSNGLRSSQEISYKKPPGTKRLLFIGDSFFWGYGVDDKDVFSELLQGMVGPGIQVINGSVAGYGTDQELLWLREEGVKYRPEFVILGFFAANDFEDISRSASFSVPRYPKPFFKLMGNTLTLRNVPVPATKDTRLKAFDEPQHCFGRLKKFLRHNTHSYPFLVRRLNAIPGLRTTFIRIGLAVPYTLNLDMDGIPDVTETVDRVLPLFEAIVREIKRVSSDAGAELLFVFIPERENPPTGHALYPEAPDWARQRNSDTSRYLSKLTSSLNIGYIDLLPAMRHNHALGKRLHLSGDHHWSAAGHYIAANEIYYWLKNSKRLEFAVDARATMPAKSQPLPERMSDRHRGMNSN